MILFVQYSTDFALGNQHSGIAKAKRFSASFPTGKLKTEILSFKGLVRVS
jgi:hypothetical protein